MTLRFHVPGIPKPKGSMRAFARKGGGRPIVTHDNKGTKPWQRAIDRAGLAATAVEHGPILAWTWDSPLAVILDFVLPRPKSLSKKVLKPATRPDLDKLTRCVLDALTGVVWRDDGQVCRIDAVKRYDPGCGPGVWITVTDDLEG